MNTKRLEQAFHTLGIATKAIDLQPADVNEQTGTFTGYLATYDLDQQKDQIVPGAFYNTIAQAKSNARANNSRVLWVILWNHDINQPIGGITDAVEDKHGLFISGFIDTDSKDGAAILSGMRKNYLQSMSIGYKTIKSTMKAGTNIRLLQEIQLYEGSVVVFPANPGALIEQGSIKSYNFNGHNSYSSEVYGMEIKASRLYGSTEIAELLGISKYLVENVIARGVRENKINAKHMQVGYLLEGTEVACLLKQYSEQLGGNTRIKIDYSQDYSSKNAFIVNNLLEAKRDDLRLDKEADEIEYQHK